MIPILYEKDEISFSSNGLGRLRDVISAVVTEERNGIYELDFEYPVTGAHFDEIQLGRIVAVEHDATNDIQPFDIVSFERPIDGVVTFHCTHISYRQNYLTVRGSGINSLADALTLLGNATPSNPFTYEADFVSDGYMAAADGLPRTVRSMLGGVEGSILDTYGGEYEWDRFRVILHSDRGILKDFSIRYGVNMVDYNEELNSEGTYSSCIPYWTDGNKKVIGSKQSRGTTVTGRGECVPMDVSDKFESKPTKEQVEAKGLSMLKKTKPYMPVQNIHVEFIRLQDVGYEDYANLYQCGLCDTINVILPRYNTSAKFKIVKTVWDVLADRYESMELGDLSTTLSEALGINEFGKQESNGYEEIKGVDKISVAASSSADIDVDNSEHLLLVGVGAGNSKMMALVNATSSGAVSNLKVAGATNMTFTNGTNKITVTNGYGYAMGVLIIRF